MRNNNSKKNKIQGNTRQKELGNYQKNAREIRICQKTMKKSIKTETRNSMRCA